MGVRTRALIGACIFSFSMLPAVSRAQDAVGEEIVNREFVGPQKEIPPQPTKADPNSPPTPVKGQPQIARVKLEPHTNDAINEAISDDINPIVLEYAKYAAQAKIESRTSDIPMRGLLGSAELLAARGGNISMNRRALSLMRRSATLRMTNSPMPAGHAPMGNIRASSRVVGPRKEMATSFQIGNTASPITSSPPPMIAAIPLTGLEAATASETTAGNDATQSDSTSPAAMVQPAGLNATTVAPDNMAAADKPVAPASMHIARDNAKPVAAVPTPAPAIDKWEKYFLDVSTYYRFTEQQHAAGGRILENLRTRAGQYRLSREKQFGSAAKLADKTQREARLGELNGPIDNMFHELKVRLENLATLNQKHQATGPAPKG